MEDFQANQMEEISSNNQNQVGNNQPVNNFDKHRSKMLEDKCERMQEVFCDNFRRIFPRQDLSQIDQRFKDLLEDVLFPNGGIDQPNKKDENNNS